MNKTKKIKPSKNIEEANAKKRTLFFLALAFILIVGGVGAAVLVPYIEKLPVYQGRTSTFDTSLITTETVLDGDNKLSLMSEDNCKLTFSSTNANVFVENTDPLWVFANTGGLESNVSMKFTYNTGERKFIKFKFFVCNEDGTNEREVTDKNKITYEKDDSDFITATYTNNSNIFISKVLVSYQLRVKN